MRNLLLTTLLLFPLAATAAEQEKEIYRTLDEDGNVIYSDTPPSPDAEPVELDPVTTVPAYEGDAGAREGDGGDDSGAPAVSYGGIEIVYPTADEVIRHNGGQVPFRVELRPEGVELAESHRIEIVVDGSVRGSGSGLTVTVGPVDRGPHSVTARVVDAGGNPLASSQPVNFFLLRHSIQ